MVQRSDFRSMACSIARSWAVVGEPWTPLVLRDLALGMSRFNEIQSDLGIARNVLSDRLRTLEAAGIVARNEYRSANRKRFEYVLTERGMELVPIVVALAQWGDRWLDDGAGPPIEFHHSCSAPLQVRVVCDECGEEVVAGDVSAYAGPGSRVGPGSHAADVLPTRPSARP